MAAPLQRLVPFVHVASVSRSIGFYARLGFELVASRCESGLCEEPDWARLRSGGADLMLARATAPVRPEEQAVLFSFHCADVTALRAELEADGLAPGPLAHPEHMPAGEFRLVDPDGYVLLVGQPGEPAATAPR